MQPNELGNAELRVAAVLAEHCDKLDNVATELAQQLADKCGMTLTAAASLMVAEFIKRWKGRAPALASDLDGRNALWRCRVRLYPQGSDEPSADSDPDIEPGRPGTLLLRGLPAVAENLAFQASAHHAGTCGGLDMSTLRHKLKSLRPTLSRHGGRGTWRVKYTAPDGFKWIARVDVERVKDGSA